MKRPATAKAKQSEPSASKHRGLIVNQKFASRFVTQQKVWEVKSSFARCVKPGDTFSLVESGIGHNDQGVALFRILGKLEFVGQRKVTWPELKTPDCREKHQCTNEEIDQLSKSWKNPYIGAVAWEVKVVKVFAVPLYTRYSGQDCTGDEWQRLQCNCLGAFQGLNIWLKVLINTGLFCCCHLNYQTKNDIIYNHGIVGIAVGNPWFHDLGYFLGFMNQVRNQ